MSPLELATYCVAAVEDYERGDTTDGFPFIRLVMQLAYKPTGRTVRMFGDCGPRGRLDIVRKNEDGYQVVALFDARAVILFLMETPIDPDPEIETRH